MSRPLLDCKAVKLPFKSGHQHTPGPCPLWARSGNI